MNDFEVWWKEVGQKNTGVLDNYLAKQLAKLVWNSSRAEQSRYIPPGKKSCKDSPCKGCTGNCCKK